MNNQQLYERFSLISKQANSLDIACELKKINKEYKKSSFYKQTRLSIDKAYKIFLADGYVQVIRFLQQPIIQAMIKGDLGELAMQLEEFMSVFDYTKLDGLFVYLADKFENLNIDREKLEQLVRTEIQTLKSSLQ